MAYASKIFTLQPNTTTVPISLPAPYDEMDIKDIDITMVKQRINLDQQNTIVTNL